MDATLAELKNEQLSMEKSFEEPLVDPHRDVETPCFVKDTVRDGFF